MSWAWIGQLCMHQSQEFTKAECSQPDGPCLASTSACGWIKCNSDGAFYSDQGKGVTALCSEEALVFSVEAGRNGTLMASMHLPWKPLRCVTTCNLQQIKAYNNCRWKYWQPRACQAMDCCRAAKITSCANHQEARERNSFFLLLNWCILAGPVTE